MTSVAFINEFGEQMGLQDPLECIDILTQPDGMWQRIPQHGTGNSKGSFTECVTVELWNHQDTCTV